MPAISATAPGKIILFGEHAVVYGRPAIAVPLSEVQARAIVSAEPRHPAGQVIVQAPDIGLQSDRMDLAPDHPLRKVLDLTQAELGVRGVPACTVRISSTVPVAAGLGSGAAVSVALIRAFSSFLGHPLSDERVCALAYEVEKLHHGTPSGIDNSVIAYGLPVYFVRGEPIQVLRLRQPFHLIVADTGIASPTAVAVGDVRTAWQADLPRYERLFDAARRISQEARRLIEAGRPSELGSLINENHAILQEMGVSCPELDALVQAARSAGALGAKLSGGGRGGNMLALVDAGQVEPVLHALISAGARAAFATQVRPPRGR